MATLIMIFSWELWNKRIARVLKHKSSMAVVVLCRIKLEAKFWSVAGVYLNYAGKLGFWFLLVCSI
jgi:hypothetical protein